LNRDTRRTGKSVSGGGGPSPSFASFASFAFRRGASHEVQKPNVTSLGAAG
jgi:hypothetical protein